MEEDLDRVIEPIGATKLDFLILGVDMVRRIVGAVEVSLTNIEQVLCGHANYRAEQQAFANAVRRDIETLNQEE